MNKAYRLVWSATRQVWIVASEKAASGGRPPLAVKRAAAFLLLGVTGSALATDYSGSTVSAGQVQNVNSGDTAHGVTVSGLQSVNSGAFTQFTLVNSGGQQHINDGAQDGLSTVNSGGIQSVNPRGEASSTTVNSGGEQRVYEDASAIGVTLNGGRQLVRGSVDQTTVNSGGVQSIDGGTALNTRVNTGGVQNVNSGGSDRFTILLGVQNVNSGGSVDKTKVLSGGVQSINGGTALNTEVRVGGVQNVNSGGSASEAAVYGVQNVNSGGSASKAAVHGVQNVNSGGMVFDTTVNTGGLLTVESGGILGGTTTLTDGAMLTEKSGQQYASVINQGILKFNQHNNSTWAGRLTGSGQLTKDGKGTLTLGGTLNQSHVNLDGGSLVMDGLQAVTDIIAKADTTLSLVNGASLTGSIDPTDVSIDDRSNWNITGDSQVNNLTNDGRIVFATQSGTFTPHTLTVSNFTGSGGTLTLNTVAGDSSSPTDKVVIDGGRASGNTGLQVLNRGGLGAQTAGSGIPVIQTINGATTDAGAFSMSNPLVAGAYEYSLYRNADESWYLTTQKTSGGDTSGGNTSGGNTSGGNTSGGNTSGGNTSGGNTSGGDTSGGNTSGGNTSGGNTSGGNTSGGNTSGGDTSGGSTSGGSTSGGSTSGGNTSGGNTSGGNTSGGSAVPSGEVNYRAAMWSYVAMPSLSMDYDRLVAGTADTRFHYAPDSRIWGRLAAGKLSHRSRGSLNGTSVPESSSAYSFFQLGGDLWQLDGANADWRAGIYGATGVMRSDIWRDGGTASAGTDRDTVYTGGAYLSGRTHSGLHIDGLLQASRHSLKAASQDGTRLSTHGTGWLVSAEVGQAFTLTPSLALDPQLQYTMQGLSLGDAQDEAASLSWSDSRRQSVRAGLKLGTPQGEKAKLAWWLTPSVTQSYGGHSGFTASVPGVTGSEASFRSNMSGTSVGLNGGVSASIRKNVKLGVQAGWSESLHGSEAGGYSGMLNLGVSFR